MVNTDLSVLSQTVGEALRERGWQLTTAESCTGGWIAQSITAVPGSSAWFQCGWVTYSNLAKQKLLGVPAECFDGPEAPGAVSQQTVLAMARGALKCCGADVAVASSGIAGPDGGSPGRPVGTVWLGWAMRSADSPAISSSARRFQFDGDRQAVREQSVCEALAGLLEIVNNQHTKG
ncbi:MAG: CinA family protein [Pseudohongiellaceae bacterium]